MSKNTFLKNYGFSLLLLAAIGIGSLLGLVLKEKAVLLKPLGDIFLNLLFSIVGLLVFFSISSAIAGMSDGKRMGRIVGWMMIIFIATGIVASLCMIVVVKIFPPALGVQIAMPPPPTLEAVAWQNQLVRTFTVPDFPELLSKKNMLAMIVFSALIGFACFTAGSKARAFKEFLLAGNEVCMKVVGVIMLYAPVGLGAYFAYLVGVFGPQLLGTYGRVAAIYYPTALFYFFVFFSLYAYIAARREGLTAFWRSITPVALTAWGTGSSVASIPVNVQAAQNTGIPKDIREMIIPIGATIHMEGSCLSAIVKIALLFGLFGMDFSGTGTILTAVGIALLSGTVMSGIPGGGFLGELMIVTLYGFPMEALPIISMVGTIVDPPATMINAVGDNVSSMMASRAMNGPHWMRDAKD